MSVPAYPEYKDSGVAWLGDVPSHWKVTGLKRYLRIVGGSTPKSDVEDYWDGNVPWVTPSDLSKLVDVSIKASIRSITEAGLASCGASLVPAGSVILSTRAPIGSLGIAGVELCTNQGCKALIPDGVDSAYLTFVLSICSEELNVRGRGSTFLELSGDELGSFKISFPPFEEQAAIATFLDRETAKIDALVAEQQRLIALLKEKRQAVISHAVTKGLNPNAPMKDSGIEWLGEIPVHWEVKFIRHFAEVLRGKFTHRPRNDPAYYDGEYPFIQTGDITSAKRVIKSFRQTLNALGASVSKEFPAGTLVMAIAANIGDVAILDFPAYFPDSVVGLVPKDRIDLIFLYYLMQAMKQPMLMTATISTQMNLNVDQIVSMTAAQPPLDEQRQIVRFLDLQMEMSNELQVEAQSAITLLQERRAALISAAVTGKIDVRALASAELEPA